MDRLAAMEAYVSVVDAGSFSTAAQWLNVRQPAVSKAISQLESWLGTRLLLRSTRGLSITDAGRRFYEHAKGAIEKATEAEQAARDSSAGLTGRLRISVAAPLVRMQILSVLKSFMHQNPGLEIEILLGDRSIDLIEGGVDVALHMGSLGNSTMIARRISRSRQLVVGSAAYFNFAGKPNTPADLAKHQAIVSEKRGVHESWRFHKEGTELTMVVSGKLRVSTCDAMRLAVLTDIGLAVAPQWTFADELAAGDVEAVLTDWALPPMDLWAVFPSGRLVTSKARAFVASVEQMFAASPQ